VKKHRIPDPTVPNIPLGSGIRDPEKFIPDPDPGGKKAPDPGSRIRNTDWNNVISNQKLIILTSRLSLASSERSGDCSSLLQNCSIE
jgi:hypothetical protein